LKSADQCVRCMKPRRRLLGSAHETPTPRDTPVSRPERGDALLFGEKPRPR